MKQACSPIAFIILALIVGTLVTASIVEHFMGSDFAHHNILHHSAMLIAWLLLCVTGLASLWRNRKFMTPAVVLIHLALVLMVVGAGITHFFAEEGRITLSTSRPYTDGYVRKDTTVGHLPFYIRLQDCQTINYVNTTQPQDYISTVAIALSPADTTPMLIEQISMNNVLIHKNWRFVQSGMRNNISVLKVAHDPWGIGTTYLGYALLLIGGLLYPLQSKSRLRLLMATVQQRTETSSQFQTASTLIFTTLTAGIGIRLINLALANGYFPCSNGHEAMLILALCSSVLGILARRFPLTLRVAVFVVSILALIVAMMSHQPSDGTMLRPVLNSPLLSLHVVSVMIAYTLFAIVATISVFVKIRYHFAHNDTIAKRLYHPCQILLYPAIFFLTTGIFIGAVWANQSWGNYWSWDPKETWALITLFIYVPLIHVRIIPKLGNLKAFYTYSALAFLSVLFTYFGVNYLLGGLHSYA